MTFWFEMAEAEVQALEIAGFPQSAGSPSRA
jgi:hypothetical protein